jgi:putative FmdB family regulatory protein
MPRYDYECRDCSHFFEVKQSFHDDALTECPKCEGSIRRVIAPVGIVFKGGGYYVTDTRGKDKSAVAATETSGASDESGAKGAAESASSDSGTGSAAGDAKAPKEGAGDKGGKAEGKDKGKASTAGGDSSSKSGGKGSDAK